MEQSQTPIRIELEGEVLDAIEVAPGLAIIRAFPSADACRFGDLVAFEAETTHDVLDDDGETVQCHTFLRVEESGGYRQFRCPCVAGDLDDVVPVSLASSGRKRSPSRPSRTRVGEQWLENRRSKDASQRDIAEEVMDLCSLVGIEAWPYRALAPARPSRRGRRPHRARPPSAAPGRPTSISSWRERSKPRSGSTMRWPIIVEPSNRIPSQ
jgi:hypothetical protein